MSVCRLCKRVSQWALTGGEAPLPMSVCRLCKRVSQWALSEK